MANPTDHLATVRAALDLAAKATTGPWAAEDGSTKWGDDHDLWSMVRDGAGSVICDMFVLASAWSLIAAEGIAEDDERDELRRINRLRSLIKE